MAPSVPAPVLMGDSCRGRRGTGLALKLGNGSDEAGIIPERNCLSLLKVAERNGRNSCRWKALICGSTCPEIFLVFVFDFGIRCGQHICLRWEKQCDVLRDVTRRDNALTITSGNESLEQANQGRTCSARKGGPTGHKTQLRTNVSCRLI